MEEKLKIIHYLLIVDVASNIVLHRILLALSEESDAFSTVAVALQFTIYLAMILFLAMVSGIAIHMWKAVNEVEAGELDKKETYPKKSFIAAAVSFLIFSLYWSL